MVLPEKFSRTSHLQFRYTDSFGKTLMFLAMICSVICGISQPILAIIGGRIANILLTESPSSANFRRDAYLCVYAYLGAGCCALAMHYIQVELCSSVYT